MAGVGIVRARWREVQPRFETYDGADPVDFVTSRNLRRRHLNESQRGMIAARLLEWKRTALPIGTAAKVMNVSARTVARANEVLRGGVPELVSAVDEGALTVSAAAEISRMPVAEQHDAVKTAVATSTGDDTKTLAEAQRKRVKRKANELKGQNVADVGGGMIPLAEVERLKAELADMTARAYRAEQALKNAPAMALSADDVSALLPADGSIPPILDRRPLLADQQHMLDDVTSAWDRHVKPLFDGAPGVVQERFLRGLRKAMLSATAERR